MTQPQHCQHECVCVSFIGSKEWTTQIVCCGKRYGDTCKHDTRTHSSATEPADPAGDCDTCRFVKECAPLYLPPCYNRGAIRAAQTPEVLESLDKLGEYADSKFEEANLSDNEREMRIHLEYTNRIWGIMKSLRGGATEQGVGADETRK